MLTKLAESSFRQAPEPVANVCLPQVWLQRCLPGRPLTGRDITSRADLRSQTLNLLSGLSQGTGGCLERAELLAELRLPAMADQAYRAAERVGYRLKAVIAHNDLNPSNLLWDGERLASVDWTWGSKRGIPCFDWFDLIAHSAFEAAGCWEQAAHRLATPSRFTDLALAGAERLTQSSEIAAILLELYVATRLANIRQRHRRAC